MALAIARPRSRWMVPVDLGVGITTIVAGGCIVGWAYGEGTVGGMIAAGSGLLMVFVGGVWAKQALSAPA